MLIIRVYEKPLAKEVSFIQGEKWKVPVGVTRALNEFKYHNFEQIPHLVLGGATRYGKSNFINSTICSLIRSKPDDVHFYMIDLKGGVELCDYENIKQTISIAYDPEEALKTLQMAYEKMREIQSKLKWMGKKNVQAAMIAKRYFVVIDEVGELNAAEAVTRSEKLLKQECQTIMSQIARLGAGLGFRLIVATQYPVGDVPPATLPDAQPDVVIEGAVQTGYIADKSLEMLANILDPFIDIMVAISFPIASFIMVGECFFFMIGNAERAWSTIMNAACGYILIQLSPLFLDILRTLGNTV